VVDVLEEPFELGAALCPVALVLVARFQQQGVLLVKGSSQKTEKIVR
jgi:hypothetical protein